MEFFKGNDSKNYRRCRQRQISIPSVLSFLTGDKTSSNLLIVRLSHGSLVHYVLERSISFLEEGASVIQGRITGIVVSKQAHLLSGVKGGTGPHQGSFLLVHEKDQDLVETALWT
jgi:hypothetical protein